MDMRPIFTRQVPGLTTVELPDDTWIVLGLDGWEWDDGDRAWPVPYAEVKFHAGTRLWQAIIAAEQGRGHDEISHAGAVTMHAALRKAADELGDSLTIREEWRDE